jgi:hypothetical protein
VKLYAADAAPLAQQREALLDLKGCGVRQGA